MRIVAYLENRLSPEEREAFKRRLGEDDELRLQYVSALMNRAGGSAEVEREPESEVMPVPEVLPEPEVTPEPEPVVVWEPETGGGVGAGTGGDLCAGTGGATRAIG